VADRLRSVKVVDARSGAVQWYESIFPACVRLTFSANSKYTKLSKGNVQQKTFKEQHQCTDTAAAVATASCCKEGTTTPQFVYKDANGKSNTVTGAPCNFAGEMVTYASAEARCKEPKRSAMRCVRTIYLTLGGKGTNTPAARDDTRG
jgi:hypothetical protein